MPKKNAITTKSKKSFSNFINKVTTFTSSGDDDDNRLGKVKALTSALKLPLMKRSVNIIDGVHPSIFKGIGIDFEEMALYQPGDSIKDIDWKSSAKNVNPVIRKYLTDSNADMVFVVDSGKEMISRTPSGERKIDVMQSVCSTFGYIASLRGDGVGIIAGDAGRIMNERVRMSLGNVHIMLKKIKKVTNSVSPTRNYAKVLSYCSQVLTKRTIIVLVFDESSAFLVQEQFVSMVRRLKERHDIFCVSIRSVNPFRDGLTNGNAKVKDIRNYNTIPAYFRNQRISDIVKMNININRKDLFDRLQNIGILHISISGTDDFTEKFAKIVRRKEVARF